MTQDRLDPAVDGGGYGAVSAETDPVTFTMALGEPDGSVGFSLKGMTVGVVHEGWPSPYIKTREVGCSIMCRGSTGNMICNWSV